MKDTSSETLLHDFYFNEYLRLTQQAAAYVLSGESNNELLYENIKNRNVAILRSLYCAIVNEDVSVDDLEATLSYLYKQLPPSFIESILSDSLTLDNLEKYAPEHQSLIQY